MLRKEKNTGICWDEKTKAKQQTNLKMQLKRINQKILAKEGNLKHTVIVSSNTNKTRLSKITKENSSNKLEGNVQRHTKNQMQRKQNHFRVKYGNGKNITVRPNG